jgi:hypothetical protein
MAIIYRNVTGPVSDAQGNLIVEGELVAKLLRPLVDNLTFISPEELRVPITNGAFTLVLAAPAMYDFQVIDQFGETWWNFQAPLDNDSPADISLAELFVLSGGYVEQDFENPITSFLGLLDTPTTYTGSEDYMVHVNAGGTGLEFMDHSATDIPDPSGEPDGQVLTTETGAAIWDDPPTDVPDPSIEPEGDVLTVSGGAAAWLAPAIDGTGRYQAVYGHLEENDQTNSISIGATSTWYPWVTGTASGNEYRMTVTSNALVVGAEGGGVHEITVQCSFGGLFNATVHGTVWHNGATSDLQFERKLSAAGDVGSASMTGLLSLIAGDTLTLAFESNVTGTLDIHHFSLVTRRVGEESQATYPDPTGESDGDVLTIDTGAAVWATPSSGGYRTFLDPHTDAGVQSATGTFQFVDMANKTQAELITDGWEFDITSAADCYVEQGTGLVIPGGTNGEFGMRFTVAQGTANTDFVACFSTLPDRNITPADTIRFGVMPTSGTSGHVCEWRCDDETQWRIEGWSSIGAWPDPGGSSMGILNSFHYSGSEVYLRVLRAGDTHYVCSPISSLCLQPGYVGNIDYANHTASGNQWRIGIWVSKGGVVCRWIRRIL